MEKKNIYLKGLRTAAVRNDMFIRMAEPPLLLKISVYDPLENLLSWSKCLLCETRANLEGHLVLWGNGLAFKNHFKNLDFDTTHVELPI